MVAYFHAEDTVVRAPARGCYELVLTVRRYGEWWQQARCEPLGPEGMLCVGSRFAVRAGSLRWQAEVVRLDPYRRIELCYNAGDLHGPVVWEFDQRDGGDTRVRHLYRGVRPNSPGAERCLADPEGLRRHRAAVQVDALAGMRRVLETLPAAISGVDLFEALYTQRAVRRFRPDPISDTIVAEILAAATRAPSARNAQPWIFVVVREAARKRALRDHYLAAWRRAQAFTAQVDADADIKERPDYAGMMRAVDALAVDLDRAPVLVLCCLDTQQLGPMADASGHIHAPQSAYASIFPAVQNLMLAARGLGIGSTLTTLFHGLEGDVRAVVELPAHVHIAALIPLGYPTRRFQVTTRKPLDQVAFLDRWGNPLPKQ